jgi:DNA-binding beta-propeller fold protein YncE
MPTTTERPAGRRLALVIATGSYADPALAKLQAPGQDASGLAAVLEDAAIGGFEVEAIIDTPTESLRRRTAQFCAQVAPGDLALVYLSCHGVLDDRGRLYYATTDTDRSLLSATAVPAAWLNEQLDDCRGRRQILVLDCCHSGAFAKGAKGESDLALGERFEGRGRVVLTGSRGTEYSFEHDKVIGDGTSSVFTSALVEGLRSGEADKDGDGVVSVSELYDYAYDVVRSKEARQTPTLWTYGAEGDLAVAQSPRGAIVEPVPLPEDLILLLESARPRVRQGAVHELAELLNGANAGRALSARAALERVASEDVAEVAAMAREALAGDPSAPAPPPPALTPPSPPPPSEPEPSSSPPAPGPRPTGAGGASWRIPPLAIAGVALVAVLAILFVVLSGDGNGGDPGSSSGPPVSAKKAAEATPVTGIPAASKPGTMAVGGSPRGIAIDEGIAWVSRYAAGVVTRIDSSTQTQESIAVGENPGKIVAAEGSVWVSIEDGERLVRIDPETGELSGAKIDLEADECNGCAATELVIADNKLWVSSEERRAITTYDLVSGEPLADPYRPGEGFEGVFTVGEGVIWAVANDDHQPSHSYVARIDPEFGEPERADLGTGRFLSAIAFGRESVYVADAAEGHNTVSFFFEEEGDLTEIAEVETGVTSDDLAYVGGEVIVWDPAEAFLTRMPARENSTALGDRVPGFQLLQEVNENASNMAIDGGFAWLTEPSGDKLHKVRYGAG